MDLADLFGRQDQPEVVRTTAAGVQPGDEVLWVTRTADGQPCHHAAHAAYTVMDCDGTSLRIVEASDEHHLPREHPVLVLRNSHRLLRDVTPE